MKAGEIDSELHTETYLVLELEKYVGREVTEKKFKLVIDLHGFEPILRELFILDQYLKFPFLRLDHAIDPWDHSPRKPFVKNPFFPP